MSSNKVKTIGPVSTISKQFQNVSKVVKEEEKPLISLQIKEPFSPEVEEFDGPSSFQKHLTEHVEEMNPLTTYKLNKKYKVEGYRITKIKGVIGLQKIRGAGGGVIGADEETSGCHTLDNENRFADLENRFNEMDTRQEEIENKIAEILQCLEGFKNQWLNPTSVLPPPAPSPLPIQQQQGPMGPHPIHPSMNMNMNGMNLSTTQSLLSHHSVMKPR
jgi:hypothetical protein